MKMTKPKNQAAIRLWGLVLTWRSNNWLNTVVAREACNHIIKPPIKADNNKIQPITGDAITFKELAIKPLSKPKGLASIINSPMMAPAHKGSKVRLLNKANTNTLSTGIKVNTPKKRLPSAATGVKA